MAESDIQHLSYFFDIFDIVLMKICDSQAVKRHIGTS